MRIHIASVAVMLLAVFVPSLAHADGVVGWYAQPAIAGDTLVFVSEGDLWRADISDPTQPVIANRLTSGGATGAVAAWPTFSPDGEQIAFALTRGGNTDVHVMPAAGGAPTRLTFHPGADVPLGFTGDGRAVAFRSARSNALGRAELWLVSRGGGMPAPVGIGECSLAAYSSTGGLLAFTPWSNEAWAWRRYRGGTMPDIWLWDSASDEFRRVTDGTANDLFPMWLRGRLWFLSDRTGLMNLFSVDADGDDMRQHTELFPDGASSASSANLDLRFARADALRGGGRIVLARGGDLLLFDAQDGSLRELQVALRSDRRGRVPLSVDPVPTLSALTLSADGSTLFVEARGEILAVPVGGTKPGRLRSAIQLTRSSAAREWGVTELDPMRLALITDHGGEQQIAVMPPDGSAPPSLLTVDRADWLFPPSGSPDGRWIAFGDKTHRLHVVEMATLQHTVIDSADDGTVWEITDYRFSPDSQWLAYSRQLANRRNVIMLHSLRTGRTLQVSDGLSDDTEPRWDPAGRYLYFFSRRTIDPILNEFDFDHAVVGSTEVVALCLAEQTPPPDEHAWHAVGLDFAAWRKGKFGTPRPPGSSDSTEPENADEGELADAAPAVPETILVDPEAIASRLHRLQIDAGVLSSLEAIPGGVLLLRRPVRGLLEETWPSPPMGVPDATLERHLLGAATRGTPGGDEDDGDDGPTLAEDVASFTLSRDGTTAALVQEESIVIVRLDENAKRPVRLTDLRLRIDPVAEWTQIFHEAWRLQRDFFWSPTMGGVDWPAMRDRHASSLDRIGTRQELDDLLRLLVGELGTSHTYVWSRTNDAHDASRGGLLGADLVRSGGAVVIERIHRGAPWADMPTAPLAAPWLGLRDGLVLMAIDGQTITASTNPHELLDGRAGKPTRLVVADDAMGRGRRVVEVTPIADDAPLRYWTWVEANRAAVAEASEGRLGYLHLPDMDTEGLVAFNRLFWPQIDRDGLVVDIRGNGGGYISQMLIQRLARRVWAFMQPRHGAAERYPARTLHGPMAVLIDQHAGSDGDIFPESFRILGLGPLIGTRTWGGVVGIRADKPSMDMGVTTQPEFAWWEPKRGWALENSGVTPDIEVRLTPADRRSGADPQLDRAVSELLRTLAESPSPLPKPLP